MSRGVTVERRSCKCGCGGVLPIANKSGYLFGSKHWPNGVRPWSPGNKQIKPEMSKQPVVKCAAPKASDTKNIPPGIGQDVLADLRMKRSQIDAAIAALEALYG